jgi:citrate lyase subunit beta/citryl-CoA lyase
MPKMRSILYVPGNRPGFIKNIPNLVADCYTLDLEDSVPKSEKERARGIISEGLQSHSLKNIYVRVNDWGTGLTYEDLDAVVYDGLKGVCLTKCKDVDDVLGLEYRLMELEIDRNIELGSVKIQLLIETAKGLMNVYPMAMASKRVSALIFGVVDYTTDMMMQLNQPIGFEYTWARQMVACAAIAADVTPIDAPYMNYSDYQGFCMDTKYSKSVGYKGRLVIHPSQIKPSNELYSPSKEVIEWARDKVKVFEDALNNSHASVSDNGQMVATAVYRNALRILEYAKECSNVSIP